MDAIMDKNRQRAVRQGIGRRKVRKRSGRRRLLYQGAMLAALAGLVALAFYAPQLVFQVQDRILCGGTVLGQRESMDAESLSTTYEKSLGKRLRSFAEGCAAGESFYVASRSLTVNEELKEFLYSASWFSRNVASWLLGEGIIPPELAREGAYATRLWKRYVIYSDDYAKGVNFILWYVELEGGDGSVCRMLVDAEDGSVYAMRTQENQAAYSMPYNRTRWSGWKTDSVPGIAAYFAMEYEAVAEGEPAFLYEELYKKLEQDGLISEAVLEAAGTAADAGDGEAARIGYWWESADRLSFQLPYGESCLDVAIEILDRQEAKPQKGIYIYPDALAGVRQIYELIPEFQ